MNSMERDLLFKKKFTRNFQEFDTMLEAFPERTNIIAEGDSWFAYPPEWFIYGEPSNLIDYLSKYTRTKANFLSLASNGDEAVAMLSGTQKHTIIKLLREHRKKTDIRPVDLFLFSGGGNDLVGEDDFERFIVQDATGLSDAYDCIEMDRLDRKVLEISLAYQELLDIRDFYSPGTLVMTHTYDYPYPSNRGAEFLGGLIKTKGWVKRFMDKAHIAPDIQADVIKICMDKMAQAILDIENVRDGFVVVDTRGTLHGRKWWLNEIHPTSKGFKKIAKKIYKKMKEEFPEL